jgi:P27 family predicted phage terminase small subunit
MERAGLLTSVDGQIYGVFCQAVADVRALQDILARDGSTYTTTTGFIRARPETTFLREARRLMLACATELGLTPASRRRMAVLVDNIENAGGMGDMLD